MIRAALFDVYGTCVDWHAGMSGAAAEMLDQKGLDTALGPAIAEGWRRQYDPSMERVRSGAEPYRTLDHIQRDSLEGVLAALGLATHFGAADRERLNAAWDALPAWPDTAKSLDRLKTAMPIAACSNGSIAMMRRLADHSGLNWSMICGAERARNYKPVPDVYLKSCAALGTDPGETIMIACHADDLDAAAACGLLTGYLPRPREWGDAPFVPIADPGRFTFHARTLPDLIDKIVSARQ